MGYGRGAVMVVLAVAAGWAPCGLRSDEKLDALKRDLDALDRKPVRELDEAIRRDDARVARELFLKAKRKFVDRSYADALDLCEEAMVLDATDPEVKELRDLCAQYMARSRRKHPIAAPEASSSARTLEESVDCSFENEPLADVLRFLSAKTGCSFELDEKVAKQGASPVTLQGRMTVRAALTAITDKLGLAYVSGGTAVFISDKKGIQEAGVKLFTINVAEILEGLNRREFVAPRLGLQDDESYVHYYVFPEPGWGTRHGGFLRSRRSGGRILGIGDLGEDLSDDLYPERDLMPDFGGGRILSPRKPVTEQELIEWLKQKFPEIEVVNRK